MSRLWLLLLLVFLGDAAAALDNFTWAAYHTGEEIGLFLEELAAAHPERASLRTIGRSYEGRPIFALSINEPFAGSAAAKPAVALIGGIHGDEAVGRELLLRFAAHLLANNSSSDGVLSDVSVVVVPSANPDGHANGKRTNGHGSDLNRDFPDVTAAAPPANETKGCEPETVALMQLLAPGAFALCVALHGGAVVANYPYDAAQGVPSGAYAKCPDDALYRQLAGLYARLHTDMANSSKSEFPGGITNGNAWYALKGGLQDFGYVRRGTISLTIELSNDKHPNSRDLQWHWDANLQSFLAMLGAASKMGVRGSVAERDTQAPISGAKIFATDVSAPPQTVPIPAFSDGAGDFVRMLAPGEYMLHAQAEGYKPSSHQHVTISKDQADVLIVDFELVRITQDSSAEADEDSDDDPRVVPKSWWSSWSVQLLIVAMLVPVVFGVDMALRQRRQHQWCQCCRRSALSMA